MREILFRGKRTDNGEWCYGHLYKNYFGDWVIVNEKSRLIVNDKTVGQYTGLKDKNGNRIFEGDIVKLRRRRDYGIVKYAIPECHFEYLMQGDGDQLLFDDVDYVEIIGNIHDNADLLGENNAKEQ